MAEETKLPACPECDDDSHVYALGNDVRWNPTFQRWELLGIGEEGLECTECDHGATIDTRGSFQPDDGGFPHPEGSIVERVGFYSGEEALAAMCLWEAVCEHRHVKGEPPPPWEADRENEGTCALRDSILSLAAQCDSDWEHAREHMGYDSPFDWEFAPDWLHHNYGKGFATVADRLAFLDKTEGN